MYADIRQAKAKTGMVEELTRRIKEGAIPLISDVPGFNAYYVIYTPDDTVMAISIFNDYAAAQESNKRALAWIETELAPLLAGPATAVAGPVIVHTSAAPSNREVRIAGDANNRLEMQQPQTGRSKMAKCDTCGNDYDKAFQVTMGNRTMTFDSFECAIQAMAPECSACGCRIIGHGLEANGDFFCCD